MWPGGWLPRCSPARLWVQTDIGGLARYQNDSYQQVERQDTSRVPSGTPGLCAPCGWHGNRLRLAQTQEDLAAGFKLLEWAARRALPSGTMASSCTHTPASHSPSRP
jgi:hypothetical protein